MKILTFILPIGAAFCLAVACSSQDEMGDDEAPTGGTSAGGRGASTGGTSPTGGASPTGGTPSEGGAAGSGGNTAGSAGSGGNTEGTAGSGGNSGGAPGSGGNAGSAAGLGGNAGGASGTGPGGETSAATGGAGGQGPAIACRPPTPPPRDPSSPGGWYTSGDVLVVVGSSEWKFWSEPTTLHVSQIGSNGDAHYIIAQNDQNDRDNPCAWTRIDWIGNSTWFYACFMVNDAATEDDALSTPAADPSDPAVGGCLGGAWLRLGLVPA